MDARLQASPERLPQLGLEDLSSPTLWQGLAEMDLPRHLEARQPLAAEQLQLLRAHLEPRLEDDERDGRFPERPVRRGYDRALQDRRMGRQRVLHLDGRDVLATADDHVLGAVLDQDVAGLVDRRHVAGAEPAVADGGGGRILIAVVAGHDACLLYTSDAADDLTRVDVGGRRFI